MGSQGHPEMSAEAPSLQPAAAHGTGTGSTIGTDAVLHCGRQQHGLLQFDLLHLQQQQHLQRQVLLAEYHRRQQELSSMHQVQLQHRLQTLAMQEQAELLEQQSQQKQQRELEEQLQAVMRKNKGQESAIASTVVKEHLKAFVLNRRPADSGAGQQDVAPGKLIQGETKRDFPLRKTVSEPNLKVRSLLRKKVSEMRWSPMNHKASSEGSKRHLIEPDARAVGSAPASEQSSPSSSYNNIAALNGTTSSVPNIHAENAAVLARCPEGSTCQSNLYTSPSLPNISLGQAASTSQGLVARQDTEWRTHGPALIGTVLPASTHLAFLPSSRVDGDLNVMVPFLSQAASLPKVPPALTGWTTVVATGLLGGLCQGGATVLHRAVSRTHSAPLPQSPQSLQQSALLQHRQQMLRRHQQQMKQPCLLEEEVQNPSGTGRVDGAGDDNSLHCSSHHGVILGDPVTDTIRNGDEPIRQWEMEIEVMEKRQPIAFQQQTLQTLLENQADVPPFPVSDQPNQEAVLAHRPLSRAKSSPATSHQAHTAPLDAARPGLSTGLVFEPLMMKHQCSCQNQDNHLEHAGRLQFIWTHLQQTGLINFCEVIAGRKAALNDIQLVHSELHSIRYSTTTQNQNRLDPKGLLDADPTQFLKLPCGGIGIDSDTYWNIAQSGNAARMAAGCVSTLAFHVASGRLRNGFAIVRPPGHHAEQSTAMGFCFFNSVAIAAKLLQAEMNVKKILIIDLDVHHGNGTQEAFYEDPGVLYISLHRYDHGAFFPGSGAPQETGRGLGEGYTVNVAFSGGLEPPVGDAEYLAAFRTVVMPIAIEFEPELILVSAGFDALKGHPSVLGGYNLTPNCYAHLVQQLMTLASGRLIMALEGGHETSALCDGTEACILALLDVALDPLPKAVLGQQPNLNAVASLEKVVEIQSQFWRGVKRYGSSIGLSIIEAFQHDCEEAEAVTAMASLSVTPRVDGGQAESLECGHGASDSSPILRKGHHCTFIVHQLMLADGTPSLTSIRGTSHTLMNHPAYETPVYRPEEECMDASGTI
uniref:histone deacetylase 4-like isoform X1 n=2 Tax=Myxine glutinosa TaxID=7769 RepID=UPI00358E24CD